jgi:hypothetical protein
MVPVPVAIGLTVCQQIVVEQGTGNVSLINALTALRVRTFPSAPRLFCIFAVLTAGHGDGKLEIAVSRADTDEVIFSGQRRAHFPNRLAELHVLFRRHECSFPAAGEYYATLAVDGEWIAQRRFRVLLEGFGS